MRKLIVDFDGTIVDCSQRDYALYADIMRDLHESKLSFNEYWPKRRQPMNIRELIRETAQKPESIDQFLKMRLERCELPEYSRFDKPLPGAYFALWMMAKLFDVYVVSARFNIDNMKNEINQLRLYGHLKDVIAAKTQNKVEAFKSLLPDVVAVIGDTEHDILAAKELGIPAIAVTTGIRSREYLESLEPVAVVDTLVDALGIIQQ